MKKNAENRPTIAIDFDGVIHKYSKGWNGGVIDDPVPGAFEFIDNLFKSGFNVFIHSTRKSSQIRNWMLQHCGTYTELNTLQRIKKGVHGLKKSTKWTPKYCFGIEIIPPRSRKPWVKTTPFWNKKNILGISNRKLAAQVYLDDRGVQFKGEFTQELFDYITNFEPWTKKQ